MQTLNIKKRVIEKTKQFFWPVRTKYFWIILLALVGLIFVEKSF